MPRNMPIKARVSTLHRSANGIDLRVNVAFRRAEVSMTRHV